jgi:hypothetical protein
VSLAQIGFLTTVTEAPRRRLARASFWGVVGMGLWALAAARPMTEVEEWALRGSYFGGGFGAVLAMVDVILRYRIL